jgi:HPt (histidine-containing phosphotransfer) domain-containing protein
MRADTPPVDFSALDELREVLGDAVADKVIATYLAALPQRRNALAEAVGVGGAALGDAAHTLAASSLSIGARTLGETCRAIEARVTAGDPSALVLAAEALVECDRVGAALTARVTP